MRLRRQIERQSSPCSKQPHERIDRNTRIRRPVVVTANIVPRRHLHRQLIALVERWITTRYQFVLLLRHLKYADEERARERHAHLIAHHERARLDPAEDELRRLVFVRPSASGFAVKDFHRIVVRTCPTRNIYDVVCRAACAKRGANGPHGDKPYSDVGFQHTHIIP